MYNRRTQTAVCCVMAILVSGCVSSIPTPQTSAQIASKYGGAQTVEDGFYVTRYPDGSGSVSVTDNILDDRWSIDCGIDAMTDRRDCHFNNELGGLFVYYGNSPSPQSVCILGHDFPGRTGQIRVDSNAPLTTDAEGCVAASRIIPQLKAGSSVTTRSYRWPYDYSVDATTSLAGFNKAMQVIDGIRSSD